MYLWASFGQFLLTINLTTTEWTGKWIHQGKTPKWNKSNLQTTEQWSEQTVQKLPNKGPLIFIIFTRLLTNSMATKKPLKFLKTQ